MEHALELNQEAIAIHREVGAKRSESICLGNWRTATKRWVNIQTPYNIMNERFESMEDWALKGPQGIMLGNLGDALLQLGRLDEAKGVLLQAIEQCRETIPDAAGAFYGTLALVYAQRDEFNEAAEALCIGEPLVELALEEYGKYM